MHFETLDSRQLMSVSLDPATHVLSVHGGGSSIVMWVVSNKLFINDGGTISNVPANLVQKIKADMASGFGDITLQPSVHINAELSTEFGNIQGGSGNDTISGLISGEARGGAGNDTFQMGSNEGSFFGEAGNDTFIYHGSGPEYADGGSGIDTFDASAVTEDQVLGNDPDLNARGIFSPVAINETNMENFTGGAGNDVIVGSAGANTLRGNGGNDVLIGNAGNDILYGGNGNDVLNGGAGKDQLYGEAGNDTFFARDKEIDAIFGGAGTDQAQVDSSDYRNLIEAVLP